MTSECSLQPDYFDRLYAANSDPWNFETSAYEDEKYTQTLAALSRPRYRQGLEIGCSIGVLTQRLAARCEHLLAVDVSAAALAVARRRCEQLCCVEFERMQIPDVFPAGPFDLVLLSEVGYYWSRSDLGRAQAEIISALEPRGELLLVHWTAPVPDYPLTGDDVHEALMTSCVPGGPLRHAAERRHAKYRLDLFSRI